MEPTLQDTQPLPYIPRHLEADAPARVRVTDLTYQAKHAAAVSCEHDGPPPYLVPAVMCPAYCKDAR